MRKKKNIYLLTGLIAIGLIIIFLFCGYLKGFLKISSEENTIAETKTLNFVALSEKIKIIDSLYRSDHFILMENEIDALLFNERNWRKKLTDYEFAVIYDQLSEFMLLLGKPSEAKSLSTTALSKIDVIENIEFKTHLLNNRSNIESDLGNYKEAVKLLFECISLYKGSTETRDFIDFYNNLGVNYRESKNYDLAIHYFEKLLNLAVRLKLDEEFGYYYANIGYTYFLMEEFDKSISLLENAKNYFVKHNQYKDELTINALLASNYIKKGLLDNAETLLLNTLLKTEEKQFFENYTQTCISLSELYIAKKNPEKALTILEKGLEKAEIINAQKLKMKIFERFVNHFYEKKDYKKAFEFQKKFSTIKDTIFDVSKNRTIRELSVKYETDKKNAEIEKLARQRKEENRKNNFYLAGLMILLAILLLIAFLLKYIFNQKKALEQANRTKDKLFSIIAHDLKSPMIALRGTELLIKRYAEQNNQQKLLELAHKTDNALFRINHLLDNLLSWSITNINLLGYNPKSINVKNILEEILSLHEMSIESKQIDLDLEIKDGIIWADLQSISCIFRNIISNAIKYTPNKGFVAIKGYKKEVYYIVSIENQGKGIPENSIKNMCANDGFISSEEEKDSFGLGLRLAFLFTKQNKGKLKIENIPSGTIVKIYLPLDKSSL